MNRNNVSYQELLKSNIELQNSVARFSLTQQELINVRDQLDNELELHRRLHNFTQKALQSHGYTELSEIILESVIDILEVECSVILLKFNSNASDWKILSEGIIINNQEKDKLSNYLQKLKHQSSELKSKLLNSADFKDMQIENKIERGLMFWATNNEISFALLGLVSPAMNLSYKELSNEHLLIFDILGNQSQTILTNQIQSQKIETTTSDLQKLSLIATKTSNNIIITDNYGRIEWVNESFTNTTGYHLEEVIGKKPKDFLQSEKNKQEDLLKLSTFLAEKKYIEIILINKTKSGSHYYTNTQITPIFNNLGLHTNFIAVQKDITDEILYKKEIEKIRDFYGQILGNSPITQYVITQSGDVIYFNKEHSQKDNQQLLRLNDNIYNDQNLRLRHSHFCKYLIKYIELSLLKKDSVQFEFSYNNNSTNHDLLITINTYDQSILSKTQNNFIVSIVDITNLKNYEKEILLANKELKKINLELDRFVYSVSHDLRSPLLSVKGLMSFVLETKELNPEVEDYLNMALNSISRLDVTIQDILDYSLNSRKDIKPESFNIEEMVKGIYEDISFISDKKIRFNIKIDGQPIIQTDKPRCKTILRNLISNSVKYRNKHIENPSVVFELKHKPDTITLIISDNGQGIPKENQTKIFEMFYRDSTEAEGTGLGLYIVKEMIEKLGGNIMVDSEVGIGTSITVQLPNYSK